ncbi:unnamed protein product, partial [Didymodactylos carnosus]
IYPPAHLALTYDQRNHYKTATRKASRNEQLRQQYDAFDVPKSQYELYFIDDCTTIELLDQLIQMASTTHIQLTLNATNNFLLYYKSRQSSLINNQQLYPLLGTYIHPKLFGSGRTNDIRQQLTRRENLVAYARKDCQSTTKLVQYMRDYQPILASSSRIVTITP